MNVREPKLYLDDILESIDLIEKYLSKSSIEEFASSSLLQDSVIRRFEIIGEAAKMSPRIFKRYILKSLGVELLVFATISRMSILVCVVIGFGRYMKKI